MPLFSSDSNRCLGVDIGSTSIKIVELSQKNGNVVLENYGISSIKGITGKNIRVKGEEDFWSSVKAISETVKNILKKANIKTKKSFFAIPDFTSFFTSFEVPKMKKSEVESAIQFQARQRIPLPLNEVTLDWKLTNLRKNEEGEELVEVLLLAVPNETVKAYRRIAEKSGLDIGVLDSEAVGLATVYGKKNEIVTVIDIGDQSTTINIIDNEIPRHSHSLDISGKDFIKDIAITPEIDYDKKKKKTIESAKKMKESLLKDLTDKIITVCDSYRGEKNRKIKNVIVTGGGSNWDDIENYLSKELTIVKGNPFENIKHPEVLEEVLKEDLGPLFTIAIGMALQGLNSKK